MASPATSATVAPPPSTTAAPAAAPAAASAFPAPITESEVGSIQGAVLSQLCDGPQRLAATTRPGVLRQLFASLFYIIADSRSVFTSGVRQDSADAMALLTTVLNPRGQFARSVCLALLTAELARMGTAGLKRLRLERHVMSQKPSVAPAAVAFITALSLVAPDLNASALLNGSAESETRFATMRASLVRIGTSDANNAAANSINSISNAPRPTTDGDPLNDPLLRGPAGTRRAGNTDIRIGGGVAAGGSTTAAAAAAASERRAAAIAAAAAGSHSRSSRRYAYLPSHPIGNATTSSNPAYVRGQSEVAIELAPCAAPAAVRMHARAFGLGGRSAIPKLTAGADMSLRKCLVLKLIFPPSLMNNTSSSDLAAASSGAPAAAASAPSSTAAPAAAAVEPAAGAPTSRSSRGSVDANNNSGSNSRRAQRSTSMMVRRGGEDVPAAPASGNGDDATAATAASNNNSGGGGGGGRRGNRRRRADTAVSANDAAVLPPGVVRARAPASAAAAASASAFVSATHDGNDDDDDDAYGGGDNDEDDSADADRFCDRISVSLTARTEGHRSVDYDDYDDDRDDDAAAVPDWRATMLPPAEDDVNYDGFSDVSQQSGRESPAQSATTTSTTTSTTDDDDNNNDRDDDDDADDSGPTEAQLLEVQRRVAARREREYQRTEQLEERALRARSRRALIRYLQGRERDRLLLPIPHVYWASVAEQRRARAAELRAQGADPRRSKHVVQTPFAVAERVLEWMMYLVEEPLRRNDNGKDGNDGDNGDPVVAAHRAEFGVPAASAAVAAVHVDPRAGTDLQEATLRPRSATTTTTTAFFDNSGVRHLQYDAELVAEAARRVVGGNVDAPFHPDHLRGRRPSNSTNSGSGRNSGASNNNVDGDEGCQAQQQQHAQPLPSIPSEGALNSFPRFLSEPDTPATAAAAAAARAADDDPKSRSITSEVQLPSPNSNINSKSPPSAARHHPSGEKPFRRVLQSLLDALFHPARQHRALRRRNARQQDASGGSGGADDAAEDVSDDSGDDDRFPLVEPGVGAVGYVVCGVGAQSGHHHSAATASAFFVPLMRRGHPVPAYHAVCGQRHMSFLVGTGEPSACNPASSLNAGATQHVLMLASSGANDCSQCGGAPTDSTTTAARATASSLATRSFVAVGAGGRGAVVHQLCAGAFFTACVTTGGELQMWGDNSYGQCSVGASLHRRGGAGGASAAVQQQPNRILFRGNNKVLQIACGATFVVAVVEGDRVLGWGSVQMLGAGPNAETLVPCEPALKSSHLVVSGLLTAATKAPATKSGSSSSAAAGTAAALTDAEQRLLDTISSCATVPCSVAALCGKGIHCIAAGPFHCLAVARATGYVYAWGYSGHGRLGLSNSGAAASVVVTTPTRIPPTAFSSLKIEAVACGTRHSAAFAVGGAALFMWGDNSSGQCGLPMCDDDDDSAAASAAAVLAPQRVRVPKLQQLTSAARGGAAISSAAAAGPCIVSVCCGEERTAVLFDDGDVLVWGAPSAAPPFMPASLAVTGVPQQLMPHVVATSVAAAGSQLALLGARRELLVLSIGVIPPGIVSVSQQQQQQSQEIGGVRISNGDVDAAAVGGDDPLQQVLFGARLEDVDKHFVWTRPVSPSLTPSAKQLAAPIETGMMCVAAGGVHSVIGLAAPLGNKKILTVGTGDWGQLGCGTVVAGATAAASPTERGSPTPTTPSGIAAGPAAAAAASSTPTSGGTPTAASAASSAAVPGRRVHPAPVFDAPSSSTDDDATTPSIHSPSLSLRSVASGHAFSFAILECSGNGGGSASAAPSSVVFFWGNNNHCQSCIAPSVSASPPSPSSTSDAQPSASSSVKYDAPTFVPALSHKGVVQIACGSFFALALTQDGCVYSWGLFDSCGLGALADFDEAKAAARGRILGAGAGGEQPRRATSILSKSLTREARVVVCCPVRIDDFPGSAASSGGGGLFTDDDEDDEELLRPANGQSKSAEAASSSSSSSSRRPECRFVRVAAGPWHAALLSHRGQVFVFGVGTNHRLGMGRDDARTHLKPVRVDIATRVRDIACGHANTLAISAQESALYVWGDNEFGQCRTSTLSSSSTAAAAAAAPAPASIPDPLRVLPSGVRTAAVTRSCTIALMWNGAVLLCGVISPTAAQTQHLATIAPASPSALLLPSVTSRGCWISIQGAAAAARREQKKLLKQQEQQQQQQSSSSSSSEQPAVRREAPVEPGRTFAFSHRFLSLFPPPPPSCGVQFEHGDDDDEDDDDRKDAAAGGNGSVTKGGGSEEYDDDDEGQGTAEELRRRRRRRERSIHRGGGVRLHAVDVVASTQHAMLVVELNRPTREQWVQARNFAMPDNSCFVVPAAAPPQAASATTTAARAAAAAAPAAKKGGIDATDV